MADAESNTPRRVKLTDRYIANLKPVAGKRLTIWDSDEPGLAVVIQPTGHRSFILMRRIRGGKPVKIVLKPAYPTLGLSKAREMAIAYKVELANGVNPRERERREDKEREERRREETKISFAAVAEAFIAKKLIGLRSAALIERVIRRDLLSRPWSRKQISAVSKDDIVNTIADIRTKRGTPGQWSTPAMRAYNYSRQILAWAMTKDDYRLEVNVCDRINLKEEMAAPERTERQRILSDVEFAAFWRACTREGYPCGDMLKFLALSCCRLNEIALAEWSELSIVDAVVELSGPILTVPARRMKGKDGDVHPHVVPITPLMQGIIDTLPKFAGAPDGFLFSRRGGRTPMSGFGQLADRIRGYMREDIGEFEHWTFHDLRRSGRSNLSRLRIQADVAERVLAHRLGGIRRTYDKHEYLVEKREALTKLSELYARIIAPIDNIEQLRAAQ